MKAVIRINNNQYFVEEGQELVVDRMNVTGSASLGEVLMTISDSEVLVGNPVLPDIGVFGDKISDLKGDKVRTFKFKAKSRYRKTSGFRPQLTRLKITAIGSHLPKPSSPAKTPSRKRKTVSEKNS